jgi:DNA ligase-1
MGKSMNHCDSIIRILRDHNSRLDKEAIIQTELESNNAELFEGLRMTFDPMITFGVKKVPTHGGGEGQGLPWEAFKELARALALRELTGHAARDAIELALGASTKSQWNDWYRLILIKDLKAGIGEATVNKVVSKLNKTEYTIPLFECMLAHDGAKNEKYIQGRKLLEPKLDGVRVITVINVANKTAIMYSRNGKLLENFGHITTAIEKNIASFERSMILDGEMVSSSFQALMKQVHRKSDVQSDDARLMLFDILPLIEFQSGESTMGQRRRSNLLRSMKPIFDQIGGIDIIPQKEVDLASYVGELEFKQYNKDAIEAGYEGIMIKDIDAVYKCERSRSWLKMKPFIEVSLEIKDVEEGTGRNMGRLGALVCSGQDDGKDITVNVGSGFSDSDRDEFWGNRDNLIGQIVEVRADAITQNQDGTYSLRFPRFLRFRGFVAGEKL